VNAAPDSARLAVGDSLIAQVHFGAQDGCAPPAPDGPTAWRWSTSDPTIALADSLRGVVHARAVGTVFIRAHNAASPFFTDSVVVQVTATR
jgi:uncharacterized protein YjdB